MRRGLYGLGVLLGVSLVAAGAVIGWRGYAQTAGPAGVVRGYFDAVSRADAADALAFGDVPPGPHTLLTAAVLREQQRIAPLRHLSVLATHRLGGTASVHVKYTLGFRAAAVPVTVSVPLHERDGEWRLDRTAVETELRITGARQRATILGAGIPAGATLLFPGALPISFDTPYLQLDPGVDAVSFDASPITNVRVQVSDAARSGMLGAVRTRLRSCLAAPGPATDSTDAGCPLPDERYVPGSVHGVLAGPLRTTSVQLDSLDPAGTLELRAQVTVTGTSRRLDFENRPVPGPRTMNLDVRAEAYAVAPLEISWVST